MSTPRRPAPRSRPAPMIATGSNVSCPVTRCNATRPAVTSTSEKWRGPDLNRRHHGFQPCALPTELPRRAAPSVPALLPREHADTGPRLEVLAVLEPAFRELRADPPGRDVDRRAVAHAERE